MNAHNRWWAVVRPALVLFVLFTLLTGVVYPLLVTAVAQTTFPHQANGSLIEHEGMIIGSELIGQPFSDPAYFWSRPSATIPYAYNAAASSGSNLAPSNPALLDQAQARIAVLKAADPGNPLPIPVDLVTASGSGLDPHISVAAAQYQANRVAQARGLAITEVIKLIEANTDGRFLGLLGEPCVNVLKLNLALDNLASR
ncbi:MAG: potassium-transporting ATPase subunit KdpC [Anaerolineae bacterium]|nr:potassium-transporting ATPase subunit KdpC [Anaerolineae bacterium]